LLLVRWKHRRTVVGALAAVAFAASLGAEDVNALNNVGTSHDALPGAWLSYGRTRSETPYGPLNQINTSNVKRLGLAWTYVFGAAAGGNQEATPLIRKKTLYGITNWSVVFAVDAGTSKKLWRWHPR
jgi:quinohemoprotein ethanol dehydrogenase